MKNRIKKILKEKNKTQGELAPKVGVKREYLNRIINGHIDPSVKLTMKIAKVLKLTVEDVFIS